MSKIMIVEDDDNIRELVLYALKSSGFEAEGLETGDGLPRKIFDDPPRLLLLDIMLPHRDGISILKELRQIEATRTMPVIMLTAKGAEMDRVKGLDMGADDYITKPFSVMELISRVKAVLRRCDGQKSDAARKLGSDTIEIDLDRRTVSVDGDDVSLTYKEFELLVYLVQNKGMALSREKLLDKVWGFDFEGETRTVDMHIKTLRRKLGAAGSGIQTLRGVGYKIGG